MRTIPKLLRTTWQSVTSTCGAEAGSNSNDAEIAVATRPQEVQAANKGGDAEPDKKNAAYDPVTYITRVIGPKIGLQRAEAITVNGMPAATSAARVKTQGGQSVDLRVVAIAVSEVGGFPETVSEYSPFLSNGAVPAARVMAAIRDVLEKQN